MIAKYCFKKMARAVNANPAPKKAKTSASKQSINADDYSIYPVF